MAKKQKSEEKKEKKKKNLQQSKTSRCAAVKMIPHTNFIPFGIKCEALDPLRGQVFPIFLLDREEKENYVARWKIWGAKRFIILQLNFIGNSEKSVLVLLYENLLCCLVAVLRALQEGKIKRIVPSA